MVVMFKKHPDVEAHTVDLGNWIFGVYFLGAIVVGIFILREVDFGEPDVLIKKKDKRLGPAYWGLYEGTPDESAELQQIQPPKPTKDSEGVAGGRGYSSGKAVKSGRV